MLKVSIKKHLDKYNLDVSFETFDKNLSLLGASGSGKSMTLKCIAGIEKPDEGFISLDGKVLYDSKSGINLSPQKRKIGYLFQNYALFPQMNLYENIFVSVNDRYEKSDKKKKTNKIIDSFHLNGLENKYPYELSGGEQQRVALARIIVSEPSFLLLDEPFSSVDSYLKWNLAKELKSMLNSFFKDMIFVSHNVNEAYFMSENVIVLSDGKIIERGKINDIINNPKESITKNIIMYSDLTRLDIDKMR